MSLLPETDPPKIEGQIMSKARCLAALVFGLHALDEPIARVYLVCEDLSGSMMF